MKHTHYHNNYRNNNYRQGITSNFVLSALISMLTFGQIPFSFLRNLELVSGGPFDGLNRGQMRKMWWLQFMYR